MWFLCLQRVKSKEDRRASDKLCNVLCNRRLKKVLWDSREGETMSALGCVSQSPYHSVTCPPPLSIASSPEEPHSDR